MFCFTIIGATLFQGKSAKILPTAAEYRQMLEAFAPISDRFEIFTCCDSIRSNIDRAIDPMTYYLGLPNERVININSTYADMVKFSSLNADLMKIIGAIQAVIKLSPTPQSRTWSTEQVFRFDDVERLGYLEFSCGEPDNF